MFNSADFVLFIGASVLLILAPGPDIIFTVTRGISLGRKAGVLTAAGLALGNIVHTMAAAFGISVIFRTSEIAFAALKICGAVYLFYLAFRAFQGRNSSAGQSDSEDGTIQEKSAASLISKGFFMNVLNPKVAIFFLAFLPQFVNQEAGRIPLQIIMLGMVFIILVAVIFGAFGYFAGTVGRKLAGSGRFSRVMSYLSSFVFISLGIKLALVQNR